MSKREKTLLFVLTLLAVALVYYKIVTPIMGNTAAVELENETLLLQESETVAKLSMLDDLIASLETAEEELAVLQESVADYMPDEEVDTLFYSMATDADLIVTALTIAADTTFALEESGELTAKYVSLTVTGDDDDMIDLVDQINSRGDVILLGFDGQIDDLQGTYQLECVLFMENLK